MKKGSVKSYVRAEGHGYIEPADRSKDVYFNDAAVKGGTSWLATGVSVEYEIYSGGGTPQAKCIRKADVR